VRVKGPLIFRRNPEGNSFRCWYRSRTINLYGALSGGNGGKSPHNASVQSAPNVKDEKQIALTSAAPAPAADASQANAAVPSTVSDPSQTIVARKEFEFPGVLASVPESRDQVMQFVSEYCPDEGDQIDILVALQEALANAALHGCDDDPLKRIHCTVAVDGADITITVRDPGPGFDLALADPDNFAATTLSHGRGICLMRSLMTEVTFAHRGAEIRFRKHISRTDKSSR
jgi:anti-sigma regulatory factor (Ser/Thr protein kinase)